MFNKLITSASLNQAVITFVITLACAGVCSVHGIINQAQHSIAQTGNQLSNELVTTGVHLSLVHSSQPTHSQVSVDAHHSISTEHRRHVTSTPTCNLLQAQTSQLLQNMVMVDWSWSTESSDMCRNSYHSTQQHTKCDT